MISDFEFTILHNQHWLSRVLFSDVGISSQEVLTWASKNFGLNDFLHDDQHEARHLVRQSPEAFKWFSSHLFTELRLQKCHVGLKYPSPPCVHPASCQAWAKTEGDLIRGLAMYVCNLRQRNIKHRLPPMVSFNMFQFNIQKISRNHQPKMKCIWLIIHQPTPVSIIITSCSHPFQLTPGKAMRRWAS